MKDGYTNSKDHYPWYPDQASESTHGPPHFYAMPGQTPREHAFFVQWDSRFPHAAGTAHASACKTDGGGNDIHYETVRDEHGASKVVALPHRESGEWRWVIPMVLKKPPSVPGWEKHRHWSGQLFYVNENEQKTALLPPGERHEEHIPWQDSNSLIPTFEQFKAGLHRDMPPDVLKMDF